MKKTNIRCKLGCKLGLFVGLLSFNTLSSCVNTGQSLGMGLCQSKDAVYKKQRHKMGLCDCNGNKTTCAYKSRYDNSITFMKRVIPGIGLITFIAGGIYYYYYFYASSTPNPGIVLQPNGLNSNGSITEPFILEGSTTPTSNMSTEQENFIIKAITTPPSWDNPSTTQVVNIRPTFSTYQEAISHIQKSRFSIESIKDYLDNGFGINQGDANGTTPLMAAVNYENFLAVKLLIDEGANVNAKDNLGRRVLQYIKNNSPTSTNIFKLLRKHGADPCIKNAKGQLIKPKPSVPPEAVELLLNEQRKKCSDT